MLQLRFGLDGQDPCSLEEISQRLGLTRERVRQLEARALRKLREPERQRPPAPLPARLTLFPGDRL